jgi:signal transduction histidine kinase
MASLIRYLGGRSRSFLITLSLGLVVLLGVIDYLTGPEWSLSIFFLFPVALAAWFVSSQAGIGVSVASAVVWLAADLLAGHVYSNPAIPYWNALVRLGYFLSVTYALSALRASIERQEELAQFIVHDLRSPLGNVLTGLQTLQEIAGESLDATQQDLIEMCVASARRMLVLINSLLDLARLESGLLPLQLGKASVEGIVEESFKQVTLWARRNGVSLTLQLASEIDEVYADPAVTMRVMVNLLSNAIKFSPPGSSITVGVAPFDATAIAFSVIDQGRGIPQEWVSKVFDKFVQVDARQQGRTLGTGLGLAFCRLAVEAQGGRIWMESESGQGTTVTFTLPLSASAGR